MNGQIKKYCCHEGFLLLNPQNKKKYTLYQKVLCVMKKNEIESKARADGGAMQGYISQKKVTEGPPARMLLYEGARHLILREKTGKSRHKGHEEADLMCVRSQKEAGAESRRAGVRPECAGSCRILNIISDSNLPNARSNSHSFCKLKCALGESCYARKWLPERKCGK